MDDLADTNSIESLLLRVQQLESDLKLALDREKAAMKLTLEAYQVAQLVQTQNMELTKQNKVLTDRNRNLEDPGGLLDSGSLGWLSRVIQVIRRVGRPLRSADVLYELNLIEGKPLQHKLSIDKKTLSVILSKGVKEKRLKIFKVAGTRGGYYAVQEWVDKEGNLIDEMKIKLL